MGFSTSGSLLIIFFASVMAFGTFYTAVSNSTDVVSEAASDKLSQQSTIHDTEINITDATWNATDERLDVAVNNTGSATLSVAATELLVNGVYIEDWEDEATVDGTDTDLWAPKEQLQLSDDEQVPDQVQETPERVLVVTGAGVTVAAPVEVVT